MFIFYNTYTMLHTIHLHIMSYCNYTRPIANWNWTTRVTREFQLSVTRNLVSVPWKLEAAPDAQAVGIPGFPHGGDWIRENYPQNARDIQVKEFDRRFLLHKKIMFGTALMIHIQDDVRSVLMPCSEMPPGRRLLIACLSSVA